MVVYTVASLLFTVEFSSPLIIFFCYYYSRIILLITVSETFGTPSYISLYKSIIHCKQARPRCRYYILSRAYNTIPGNVNRVPPLRPRHSHLVFHLRNSAVGLLHAATSLFLIYFYDYYYYRYYYTPTKTRALYILYHTTRQLVSKQITKRTNNKYSFVILRGGRSVGK